MNHRVVIVGGGFGGLYAALHLKKTPVELTLVDRRNFHLFQPLLYQVATGALSPGNIASPLRHILQRHRHARVLLAEAEGIDVAGRQVLLKDAAPVPYETLIVAAGTRNNYFGHPEWEEHAPGLKSVEDALRMRQKILNAFEAAEREPDPEKRRAWLTFVVVGAGPTGVELAGALGEIVRDIVHREYRNIEPGSASVLLVDLVDRVLPVYSPALSAKAQRSLERLGVQFRSGVAVTGIEAGAIRLKKGGKEERLAAQTILWAAGVQTVPLAGALAKAAGVALQRGGRLAVQPDLTLPGHPEIFVIGDMAAALDAEGKPLPGIAPVAIQEGEYAARLIRARIEGKTMPPFRYRHKGDMATIGRAAAVAQWRGLRFSGLGAWLAWLFVHLWFLVEFENRLLVFTQWAWNYFTRNRSARLITGP